MTPEVSFAVQLYVKNMEEDVKNPLPGPNPPLSDHILELLQRHKPIVFSGSIWIGNFKVLKQGGFLRLGHPTLL